MESTYESLDTSVLLRLILNDDYAATKKIMTHLLNNTVDYLIDDYVLGEIEVVLKRQEFSREKILAEFRTILENPMFVWNKAIFRKVFRMYEEHPSLSFNDCYLAVKAEEQNAMPIWTLDKKFANQTRQAKLIV